MKKRVFLLVICLLASCAAPVESTPTATAIPATSTLTPSPTSTSTPSPTSTPTITPTMVGGSEPFIAFIARDAQGNVNLYVDGFYTGQPKIITRITLPEGDSSIAMKWSPDGRKIVFTNLDENGELWVVAHDVRDNNFQKLYRVPAGRYAEDYKWSADNFTVTFETVNSVCCNPGWANFRVNLTDGSIERVEREILYISNVTRVNNEAACPNFRDPTNRRLRSAGYDLVCYFPEIGLYGGLKHQPDSVDYDLLSEDGQVQRTLFRFPAGFYTNGYMDLLLSPDKSRALMIAEPLRPVKDYMERGIPFAIPVSMTDTSIETADPETLFYDGLVYEATPPPHELMSKFIFGWSPDSRSYIEARFYFDGYNRINFTAQGEIVVINAESGDVLYTYSFQSDLQPLTAPFPGGFDIVWPAQP